MGETQAFVCLCPQWLPEGEVTPFKPAAEFVIKIGPVVIPPGGLAGGRQWAARCGRVAPANELPPPPPLISDYFCSIY